MKRATTLREKGSDSVRQREGFEEKGVHLGFEHRTTHSRKPKAHNTNRL